MHISKTKMPRRWQKSVPLFLSAAALMLSGCAPSGNLPAAGVSAHTVSTPLTSDDDYISFRSTHENSPKIPTMIISLIKSHTAAGEYQLAEFYCNEYRRDFPSGKRRAEVEYLSIKALYLHNKQHYDERFYDQIKAQARFFAVNFSHSIYHDKVKKIISETNKERNDYYEQLAKEYESRGKPKAAEFYRKKIKK